MSNYRPGRLRCQTIDLGGSIKGFVPSSSRLTPEYQHEIGVELVDLASHASITTVVVIIKTSYTTHAGRKFGRRHQPHRRLASDLVARSHVGLNWPPQAPWLQASFLMRVSHPQRKLFPSVGPTGGHVFPVEVEALAVPPTMARESNSPTFFY